jgi:F-type H+-transporting ATPase subunit a
MANKINTSGKTRILLAAVFTIFSVFGFSNEPVEPQDSAHHAQTPVEEHAAAHKEGEHGPKKKVNIAEVAFEHILDSHSWHFWGEHENAVSVGLPVILKTNNGIVTFNASEFNHDTHGQVVVEKDGQRFVNYKETIYYASETKNEHEQYLTYSGKNAKGESVIVNEAPLDFSLTKNVIQLFLTAIILILLFTSVARAYKRHGVTSAPKGKQSFLEPLIVFVRDDIAKENIGAKGDKFVPYLLTVFFLILINNILGLIPVSANLTGNIAFTMVLAVCTLIVTNINGNKHYWSHIFLPHAPKAIWPILIPIEIIGILTKPFALMIRLFANMSAGHIIVIALIGLIFLFETALISPVSVAFALFIDVLEVLVAVLQAYIFTMLTSLFIGGAVADVTGDGAHTSDDEVAHAKH